MGKLFTDIRVEITGIGKRIEELTAEKASPQPMAPPHFTESHTHEEEKDGAEEKGKMEETSAPQETAYLRKCPTCGGQINFLIKEAMWKCYTCGHEESAKDETEGAGVVAAASEPVTIAEPAPVMEPAVASEDMLPPIATAPLESSPSVNKPVGKKKSCPVCHKQMDWHEMEKRWNCPFCNYQGREF